MAEHHKRSPTPKRKAPPKPPPKMISRQQRIDRAVDTIMRSLAPLQDELARLRRIVYGTSQPRRQSAGTKLAELLGGKPEPGSWAAIHPSANRPRRGYGPPP